MELVEERSFAPSGEGVKTAPINEDRPTMRALAKGHNRLHECLEEARGDIDKLMLAQGLRPGQKPVSGLSSRWESFRRTVYATTTSITAVGVAYVVATKIVWPMIVVGWTAFEHVASKGGL